MSKTAKRVLGAVVGVTALAFLGIFTYGVVDCLRAGDPDEDPDDYDDDAMGEDGEEEE